MTERDGESLFGQFWKARASGAPYLGDPQVVGALVGDFLVAALDMDGQQIIDESARLSRIFAGQDDAYVPIGEWNGAGLARSIRALLPQLIEMDPESRDDTRAIQQALVFGVLISRDLVKQAGQDVAAYLRPFCHDWARLMLGVPMQRQWTAPPEGR